MQIELKPLIIQYFSRKTASSASVTLSENHIYAIFQVLNYSCKFYTLAVTAAEVILSFTSIGVRFQKKVTRCRSRRCINDSCLRISGIWPT